MFGQDCFKAGERWTVAVCKCDAVLVSGDCMFSGLIERDFKRLIPMGEKLGSTTGTLKGKGDGRFEVYVGASCYETSSIVNDIDADRPLYFPAWGWCTANKDERGCT